MKHLINAILVLPVILLAVSCDYFYQMDIENNYERGIYVWSSPTALDKGDAPASLDELSDAWYLHYVEPGQMGSFASMLGGNMTMEEFVDEVFEEVGGTLLVAIFDAVEMDANWGVGKMSDYVIQKYWLTKEDVLEEDGETFKRISFPPHEGMKDIRMEPAYGTYPSKVGLFSHQ